LFKKRPYLRCVADTFQYLIQKENTPQPIIERLRKSRYLKKFTENPKKATVNMAPRAGKSYVVSVCSAWALGNYPVESLMRNSCTERLYQKFSYDVRNIVKSDKFKEIFDVVLSSDKQSLDGWNTDKAKQVSYFGAGVGGTIIGFGASLISITDDLYRGLDDALSETINENTHRWKDGAHNSRIEGDCPNLDIGTRWSKNDVIGKSMENGEYDIIIIIPALVDGKSFCESVRSTESYLEEKRRTTVEIWDAEYMQSPVDIKGIALPEKDLQRFKMKDFKFDENCMKVAVIDTADEGTDYLSMPIGYLVGGKIYIPDVIFTTSNTDVTIPLAAEKCRSHKLKYCRVETNSGGSTFMKELRKKAAPTMVTGDFHHSNKHTRVLSNLGFIKEFFVFRDDIEPGSEYEDFIKQMTTYLKNGKSKHDDAIDSVTAMAEYLLKIAYSYFESKN